jgi:DNA repair protein RecO (recombination protein O)
LVSAVRHLFPGEEASAPVFNLLVRGIARLAEAPDGAAAAGIVLAARLKLLALLGYAPEMSRCAACGAEGPLYGFSPSLGGAVCSGCAETGTVACFALSGGAQATLCTLLQSPLAEVERLDLDDRATAEVEQVLAQTLAYHGH